MTSSIFSQQLLISFSLVIVFILISGGILVILFKKENKDSDIQKRMHPVLFKFEIDIGFLVIFLGVILHLYILKTFNNDKFIDINNKINRIDDNISILNKNLKSTERTQAQIQNIQTKNKELILKLNQKDKNGTNSN